MSQTAKPASPNPVPDFSFKPRADSPFLMDPWQVAVWFVDVHAYWFDDPSNDLYRRQATCRDGLYLYLLDGRYPGPRNQEERYVVDKYRQEAEGWFVKVTLPVKPAAESAERPA